MPYGSFTLTNYSHSNSSCEQFDSEQLDSASRHTDVIFDIYYLQIKFIDL